MAEYINIPSFSWDGSSQPDDDDFMEALNRAEFIPVQVLLPNVVLTDDTEWSEKVSSQVDDICWLANINPHQLAASRQVLADVYHEQMSDLVWRRAITPLVDDDTIGSMVRELVTADYEDPARIFPDIHRFDPTTINHNIYVPHGKRLMVVSTALYLDAESVDGHPEIASTVMLGLAGLTDNPNIHHVN